MKIAFCHHLSLSYFGGGEKWLIELANELVKRGYDVEIFALPFLLDGEPKVDPRVLLEDGVAYSEGLRRRVRADVCYVTYHPLNWLNFETSRPRVAGFHSQAFWSRLHPKYGVYPNVSNLLNRLMGRFELKRFDAIHTVTPLYHINHPRVYCIPNFVDSERFKPCERKPDVFTVAFASRMVWQKGWDTFLETRERFGGDIEFNVSAGKIPEEKMPNFLSAAHVTVAPSRVDTFGLAIVESLMCGTPVITTSLSTHKMLDLPLLYADYPDQFVVQIFHVLQMTQNGEYSVFARKCREAAMKYDKRTVVDELEKMLVAVAK